MASSRIFIRGLPPAFTESEFRKHFGSKQPVTDAKLFPQRRIGYVGYKTPEDAANAVKYFNRTFIRMSKIAVEIARPIHESVPEAAAIKQAPTRPLEQELSRADTTPQVPGSLKRKRGSLGDAKDDPKLQEFLQVMQAPSKVKGLRTPASGTNSAPLGPSNQQGRSAAAENSDSEYDAVPKKTKPSTQQTEKEIIDANLNTTSRNSVSAMPTPPEEPSAPKADGDTIMGDSNLTAAVSDNDWLRSRTSRLLGLVDDEEDDETVLRNSQNRSSSPESGQQELRVRPSPDPVREFEAMSPQGSQQVEAAGAPPVSNKDIETIRDTMRLYIRNLPYGASEDDLRKFLLHPDQLEEARNTFFSHAHVHVPVDPKTGEIKGFAFVQFNDPDAAIEVFQSMDGKIFQGRLLHVLPAASKRETTLDDFALSKLPLKKQQQIKKRREAASSTFNWNALYMNADAVMSSVADRLGVSKSELLDPTSSDAAIKQAHAETHIIQETKAYFRSNGVDLEAFKKQTRGDTAILVKNFPYDCKADELKAMFEEHGLVTKFLMPPTGTIAIVEFASAAQARTAFGALAYRKIKSSVLYLEKAPKDLFQSIPATEAPPAATEDTPDAVSKLSATHLLQSDSPEDGMSTASLF
ncbi:hypothetical protein LTR28_010607, partial [Elasticomyces elasticus]